MMNSLKMLLMILGVFLAVGFRNVSIGQVFSGAFNGVFIGIDTSMATWNDYQKENSKRGIGKIRPYDGKPYSSNDF